MIIKTASLPPHLLAVIQDKGTEPPHTGEYNNLEEKGTYLCRQCGLALYRSSAKFHSGCGWPSFDAEIDKNILHLPDKDGIRTEILCARCEAHLGHVFTGEGLTASNIRHCVNAASLDFVTDTQVEDTEEAIFAAGCFWGVEYLFQKQPGVLKTEVGYTGGHTNLPTYESVCRDDTGHYEAVRVVYDSSQKTYEDLVKFFFEIHDFTQNNGQGPDIGQQYRSVIFYYNEQQKQIAADIITLLENKYHSIATKLLPVSVFWRAETYHQGYYQKNKKQPYCHRYEKKFDA